MICCCLSEAKWKEKDPDDLSCLTFLPNFFQSTASKCFRDTWPEARAEVARSSTA